VRKLALVLVLGCLVSMAAIAQEPRIYVQTLYVERVYPTTLGYRIDYRLPSSLMLASAYLPLDWFGRPESIARIVYQQDRSVPFINIFWEDGEISHIVLYVHRDYNHISWGSLQLTEDLRARFNLERPTFRF
jgi:hypothetical protein